MKETINKKCTCFFCRQCVVPIGDSCWKIESEFKLILQNKFENNKQWMIVDFVSNFKNIYSNCKKIKRFNPEILRISKFQI